MKTIIIFHNEKEVKKFEHVESDFCAFKWLLDHQSCSVDRALKVEGYKVTIIDEETKEITNW